MRLRNIFLNPDERMVVEACEDLFKGVCDEEGSAAQVVFARHPDQRAKVWNDIRRDVLRVFQSEGATRVRAIRAEMAEAMEECAVAHFYTHLEEVDRDVIARNIFSSTVEQQDRIAYFSHPRSLARAHVFSQVLYLGWTEGDEAKESVRKVERVLLDTCKEHWNFLLRFARAKEEGVELSDADVESAKTTLTLKNLAKRALAGEAIE